MMSYFMGQLYIIIGLHWVTGNGCAWSEATIDLVPQYLFTTVYFGTIDALSLDIVMEVIRHAESIVYRMVPLDD